MFRIPSFYQDEVTFEEAKNTMTTYGRGDLLEGMMAMDRRWTEHCASSDEDDTFFETYIYEVNAYNTVFKTMKPLFV